jgi:hypothetical protein
MNNFTTFVLIIVLLQFTDIGAQKLSKKSSFISGLVGAAQVGNSSNGRESGVALTFGGSFGFPVLIVQNLIFNPFTIHHILHLNFNYLTSLSR